MPRAGALTAAPGQRLANVRALIGLYSVVHLLARTPHLRSLQSLPESSFDPVGVAHLFDGPIATRAVLTLVGLGLVTGTAFAFGRGGTAVDLAHLVVLLTTFSYSNSFSQIFHTEHLLTLHVLTLTMARPFVGDRASAQWALRLMMAVTAATYLVAGIAKLKAAGLGWTDGENLRNWVAFDNLRKAELGDVHSPLAGPIVAVRWWWTPAAIAALVVELGAPLALLGRRWALSWAIGAWVFHVVVLATMAIVFPYQLAGVAYAVFLPVEKIPWRVPHGETHGDLRPYG